MSATIFDFANVCKSHLIHHGRAQRGILSNINLRMDESERRGILEHNGAGKSTRIRLIGGAEYPHNGTITHHRSISWPLAFSGAFQGYLTGRDNVKQICRVYHIDFEQCMVFVGSFSELRAYLRKPIKSYSSGMAARPAFAIFMPVEFDCFLIDEAMAVSDHRFHQKCDQELFKKRGDRTMIIVAHQMDPIREHCDHASILENGELIVNGGVEEAIAVYNAL